MYQKFKYVKAGINIDQNRDVWRQGCFWWWGDQQQIHLGWGMGPTLLVCYNSKLVNLFAHKRCAIWHAQIFRIHISILFSCMYPANTEVVFSGAQEKVDNYLSYFGHVWPRKATTNIRHFMCHQHFIIIFHNFVFWSYFQSSIGHVSWLLSLMSSPAISNFRQPVLHSLTFKTRVFPNMMILYFI